VKPIDLKSWVKSGIQGTSSKPAASFGLLRQKRQSSATNLQQQPRVTELRGEILDHENVGKYDQIISRLDMRSLQYLSLRFIYEDHWAKIASVVATQGEHMADYHQDNVTAAPHTKGIRNGHRKGKEKGTWR
jgi:hypothetical protein